MLKKIFFFILIANLFSLVAPLPLLAAITPTPVVPQPATGAPATGGAITTGVSSFGNAVYGSTPQAPGQIVALIIRALLGLLGLLFFCLVVYGGFLYMTAGGEESKITKAKGTIKTAVIGLIIILLAYAISSFIISQLLQASGPGSPPPTTPPPAGPGTGATP